MAATIQIKRGTSGPINLTHLLDGELAYDKDNNKLYIGKDGSKTVINSIPTAAEVGADPSGSANTALTNAKAYTDTALNTAKSYTDTALNTAKSYTDTSVANLINSAPTTLDTLGEIAAAMNENAEVVDALEASIGTKANASDLTSHTGNKSNPHGVTLSQLGVSATATELNYVDGVTSNIQTQLNAKAATSAIPTKTSQLTNDSGFKTTDNNTTYTISKSGSTITLTGSDGKTSSVTDSDTNTTYSAATTSAAGLMSAADKTKLDGIATGANKITVDTALSSTSTNPVQNKVINTALASKANTSAIPTKTSQLTNDSGFKTTDNNTTYSLSKSGSTITLTGSDGSKTSVTDADTNTTYSAATTSANGLMTSTMVTKLNGIATGANNYSHPTTSGNKHIPSGGSSGQILRWSADGTAVWGADNTVAATTTTPKAAGTAAVGSETKYAKGDHVHPAQTTITGNAGSATKLATARNITLDTAVNATATSFNGTADITIPVTSVKESYLTWGGRNIIGEVSPIGASLSSEHSANRLAFLNPAALTIEYSNDGGSTWTDAGLTDQVKVNFVTTSTGIGVGSASTVTTNHRTRVLLTAQNGTTGYVYTRPRKMLLNISTAGHGLQVTVEYKTGVSGASWKTLGVYTLNGWSGWNDIPLGLGTLGGGVTQTGNNWYLRLTFATTSVHSSYTTTKSTLISMRIFGDTSWTSPSTMATTGHLYTYDYQQNAGFPNGVSAKSFTENGTALSSKYAAKSHTHSYATVHTGTGTPAASLGNNGDIYIVTG